MSDTDHASDLLNELGQTVRERRRRKGYSQEGVAATAGVSMRAVQRIEHGKNTTFTTLLSVCQALDCQLLIMLKE